MRECCHGITYTFPTIINCSNDINKSKQYKKKLRSTALFRLRKIVISFFAAVIFKYGVKTPHTSCILNVHTWVHVLSDKHGCWYTLYHIGFGGGTHRFFLGSVVHCNSKFLLCIIYITWTKLIRKVYTCIHIYHRNVNRMSLI